MSVRIDKTTATRVSADDFFTGLFAALRLKGFSALSLRQERFDRAVAAAFERAHNTAAARNIELRFRIRLHPIHTDSPTIRDAVTYAAQRDLISLDNPEYQDLRLKLNEHEAEACLSRLAGGAPFYREVAEQFVERYV